MTYSDTMWHETSCRAVLCEKYHIFIKMIKKEIFSEVFCKNQLVSPYSFSNLWSASEKERVIFVTTQSAIDGMHADFTDNVRIGATWQRWDSTSNHARTRKEETLHTHVKRQVYMLCPSKVESVRSPLLCGMSSHYISELCACDKLFILFMCIIHASV